MVNYQIHKEAPFHLRYQYLVVKANMQVQEAEAWMVQILPYVWKLGDLSVSMGLPRPIGCSGNDGIQEMIVLNDGTHFVE